MLPGPILIYKCPKCGSILKNDSLDSGNTCGAKLYSDGKQDAPMLPDYPNLTKCNKCDSIFWLSELKIIGECRWDCPTEWENAPFVDFLNLKDLFRALNENTSKKKEVCIRQMIWWTFNDRLRQNKALFIDEDDENLWQFNCSTLLKLLDKNDINQKIMIAELYRNLGQYEQCLEIINSLPDDFDWLKNQFKVECKKHNPILFEIKRK
jgi:uncharacterized C2H2 Zn-finger protein